MLSTVVGYNVYRSTVSDSGFTKLNSSLVTTVTLHGRDRAECNDLFLCSHGGELPGQRKREFQPVNNHDTLAGCGKMQQNEEKASFRG